MNARNNLSEGSRTPIQLHSGYYNYNIARVECLSIIIMVVVIKYIMCIVVDEYLLD